MSRAGSGARDQVARLLALVPLLHSREGLQVTEAAELLATTPDQVVKDLRVLWMCGLPGGMTDDLIDVDMEALEDNSESGVIHVSNADYLARPVRLSSTEASALAVALRAVRDSSPEETRAIVDSVITKLEVAVSHDVTAPRVAVEPARDGLPLRSTLSDALDRGRRLRLTYWVPSRDEVGERDVDPLRLDAVNGVDYLEAWCHRAEGRRVFRLDRIHGAELLETPAAVQPEVDAGPLSVDFLTAGEAATTVTLLLDPEVRWVPEYYPVEAVRHLDDGRLEVELQVVDTSWLRQLVLRLAPHAIVLAPAGTMTELGDAVEAALDLYP